MRKMGVLLTKAEYKIVFFIYVESSILFHILTNATLTQNCTIYFSISEFGHSFYITTNAK